MIERNFEEELHNLICDILRTHRSRQPETQEELTAATEKMFTVIDAMLPPIQELIAAGVMAINTE